MRRLPWRKPRSWGDLDARARGLSTRLLSREQLAHLAAAPTEPARIRTAHTLLGVAEGQGDLERLARQVAASSLARLARWAGPRARDLRVVFEDEDRRSVRTLLRGAAQGAGPERRLAGLLPTPTLPERALEELARRRTVEDVLRGLEVWGHAWGLGLVARLEAGPTDLFTLGLEVDRLFAHRAVEAARGAGRTLQAFAQQVVDILNASSVLLADRWFPAAGAAGVFLAGGRVLSEERFTELVALDPAERRVGLARAFAGSTLGPVFADPAVELAALETTILRARIGEQRRAALLEPLGPASVFHYVLRLRAQVVDLSRIGWGAALAADPATIVRGLVTS